MKIDMNDIAKALGKQDYCQEMVKLGFTLMFFDEDNYPDDFLFISEDDELIVLFRSDLKEFWTYPRANHKKIGDAKTKKEVIKHGK